VDHFVVLKVFSPNGFDMAMLCFREGNDVWVRVGYKYIV